MSGSVFPDVALDTQIDQSIFRKRCLLFLLYYAECGLPNPFESQTNTPADQPSHEVDAPVEIQSILVGSAAAAFATATGEVAVPLAAGGLHALRKGLAAKMCHGHPWSKDGKLFHTTKKSHKGMVPFIGI